MKRHNETVNHYLKMCLEGKRHHLFLLTLIQVFLGVLGVGFAFLLRYLIRGLSSLDNDLFMLSFFLMLGISALIVGFQSLYRYLYEVAESDIENALKRRLFSSLLHAEYEEVKATHDEDWIHRLSNDTNVVASAILSILPSLFRMGVQLIAACVAIAILSPNFMLVLLPCIALLLLFTYFLRKRLKRLHKEVQEADGRLKIFFAESLEGLSVIASFVKEDVAEEEGERKMEEHKKAKIRRTNFQNLCAISFLIVYYLAYLLALFMCGNDILNGKMDVATLASLLALLSQIQGPLGNLTNVIPRHYAMIASAERLTAIEGKNPNMLNEKEARLFYDEEFESVRFDDTSFSYKDKDGHDVKVMDHFSYEIKKGETLSVSGPSGIGKSTLISLLLGLYKPREGKIVIKSKNGEEILTPAFRPLFSYVPQNNLLFQGSIEEIVSFFDPVIDKDRLASSLELAGAKEFVDKLEKGVKTDLKEHGTGLSLGEIQRLAIARAIYHDAPILLLDEATSSLDEKNEAKVLANLASLKNKTIIFISHHKAVTSFAKKELVFEGGKNE